MTTSSSTTNGPENVAETRELDESLVPEDVEAVDLNVDVGECALAEAEVLGQVGQALGQKVR